MNFESGFLMGGQDTDASQLKQRRRLILLVAAGLVALIAIIIWSRSGNGEGSVDSANLAPRVMMGTESQGMILMAEDPDGKLCFVSPDKGWPGGMGVR